jgi:hypothetical protein
MKKVKGTGNEERRTLASAIEAADSYLFAAMATARDGMQSPEQAVKHFLVIEDLLTKYRETIYTAIDGKAA